MTHPVAKLRTILTSYPRAEYPDDEVFRPCIGGGLTFGDLRRLVASPPTGESVNREMLGALRELDQMIWRDPQVIERAGKMRALIGTAIAHAESVLSAPDPASNLDALAKQIAGVVLGRSAPASDGPATPEPAAGRIGELEAEVEVQARCRAAYNNGFRAGARHEFARQSQGARVPGEWRPIESAPKDGTSVLLSSPGSVHTSYGWWRNGEGIAGGRRTGWFSAFGDYLAPQPTIWHAVPKAPLAASPNPGEA